MPPPTDPDRPLAWTQRADARGRTLRLPVGWHLQTAADGDLAASAPSGDAAALVRQRPRPAAPLHAWLAHHYPETEPGLRDVHMLLVDPLGPGLVRAVFEYGGPLFRGRAGVLAAAGPADVTLYVAAAAFDTYARSLPTLARVLDSLRPRPPALAGLPLGRLLTFGAGLTADAEAPAPRPT